MISYERFVKSISENLRPKQEDGASTNMSDAISDVRGHLQEFNLLLTERATLRMYTESSSQTSLEVDDSPLTEENSTTCNPIVPVTVRENVRFRKILQPISAHHSEKTKNSRGDEGIGRKCDQFRGDRGYFDEHYLSVTVPTPLILTARSIMVEELGAAGIKISAIHSTAAGLVYDFIAGGDLERRKRAQDLLLQHHGHCKLLVVEVGQGFTCCSVVLLQAIPLNLTEAVSVAVAQSRDQAVAVAPSHTNDASTSHEAAYRSVVIRVEERAGSCVYGLEEADAACLIDWIGSLHLPLNSSMPSPYTPTPTSHTSNAQTQHSLLAEEDWVIASGEVIDASWAHSPQRNGKGNSGGGGVPICSSSDSAQETTPVEQQRFTIGRKVWVTLRPGTREECLSALRTFRYSYSCCGSVEQNQNHRPHHQASPVSSSSSNNNSDSNSNSNSNDNDNSVHIEELCESLLGALERDDGWLSCPSSPYGYGRQNVGRDIGSSSPHRNHYQPPHRGSGNSYENGDDDGRYNENRNGCGREEDCDSCSIIAAEGEGEGEALTSERADTNIDANSRMALTMPHGLEAKQRLIAALNLYGSAHCSQLDLAFQIDKQLESILPRRAVVESSSDCDRGRGKIRKPAFPSTCSSPSAAASAGGAVGAPSSSSGNAIHGILLWCDCPALSLVIQDPPPVVDSLVKTKGVKKATQEAPSDADIIMSMHIFFSAALRGALREFLEVVIAAPSSTHTTGTSTSIHRRINGDRVRHRERSREKVKEKDENGDGVRDSPKKSKSKASTKSFPRQPTIQSSPSTPLPRTLWPLRPASLRDGCTGLTRQCANAHCASPHQSTSSGIMGSSVRILEGLCASLFAPFGVIIRRTVDLQVGNVLKESGKRKERKSLSLSSCVHDSNIVWCDGPTAEGEFDVMLRCLPSSQSVECSLSSRRPVGQDTEPAAVAAEVFAVHSIGKEPTAMATGLGAASLGRIHAGSAEASLSVPLGSLLGTASFSPSTNGCDKYHAGIYDSLNPVCCEAKWSVLIVQRVEQDLEVLRHVGSAQERDEDEDEGEDELKEDVDKSTPCTTLCSVELQSHDPLSVSQSVPVPVPVPAPVWLLSLRASHEGGGLYIAQATMMQQSSSDTAKSCPLKEKEIPSSVALSQRKNGTMLIDTSSTPVYTSRYAIADHPSNCDDKGDCDAVREEWKATAYAPTLVRLILKAAMCAIIILQLNIFYAAVTRRPKLHTWAFRGLHYIQHLSGTELGPQIPPPHHSNLHDRSDLESASTGHCGKLPLPLPLPLFTLRLSLFTLPRIVGENFITMRRELITDKVATVRTGTGAGSVPAIPSGTQWAPTPTPPPASLRDSITSTSTSTGIDAQPSERDDLHWRHRVGSRLDGQEGGSGLSRGGRAGSHLAGRSAGTLVREFVVAVKRKMRLLVSVFRWIFEGGRRRSKTSKTGP